MATVASIAVMVALVVFVGVLIATMVILGKVTASKDVVAETSTAITQIMAMNLTMIVILAGLTFFYRTQSASFTEPYLWMIMHASLFFSILAVSISAIQKTSMIIDVTSTTTTTA